MESGTLHPSDSLICLDLHITGMDEYLSSINAINRMVISG